MRECNYIAYVLALFYKFIDDKKKFKRMKNIVLFGAPGSGKGTQAKKIMEKHGLFHISTGDMIRKEISEGTDFGNMASEIINKGNLLSDKFVVSMIENVIKTNQNDKGFLFDGFPRTTVQAEMLDRMLEKNGEKVSVVMLLKVPYDKLMIRMLKRAEEEGRPDDNENVIKNRFENYKNKTLPVATYYSTQNKCKEINGDKSVDEVFETVEKVLCGID